MRSPVCPSGLVGGDSLVNYLVPYILLGSPCPLTHPGVQFPPRMFYQFDCLCQVLAFLTSSDIENVKLLLL